VAATARSKNLHDQRIDKEGGGKRWHPHPAIIACSHGTKEVQEVMTIALNTFILTFCILKSLY
jgi:hypothetical protein